MRLWLLICFILSGVIKTYGQILPLGIDLVSFHKRLNELGSYKFKMSPGLQILWQEHFTELKGFQAEAFFVKPDKKILFYENGTGRLLQLDSTGNLERMDRTNFGGERFGAQVFFFRDTLFSIGGYGFWQLNGAVRFFDEKTREWSIVKTNRDVPAANGINGYFFYNKKQENIYCIYNEYSKEYLLPENTESEQKELLLQVFNLRTKRWNKEPFIINPFIGREINDLRVIHVSEYGLFLQSKFHSQAFEIDFEKNAVYEIDEHFVTHMSQLNKSIPLHLLFSSDSSICFLDMMKDSMVHLNTRSLRKDKKVNLYTLYKPSSSITEKQIILFLGLLNVITIGTFIVLYLKKRRTSQLIQQVTKETGTTPVFLERKKMTHFIDLLNDIELQIVNTLSRNHKAGKNTSIDEINKLIGIEKRPYKIRNNMRAEVLKMINKKFMDFSTTQEELIERERSNFDKRYFEYKLNERYSNKVQQKINGAIQDTDQ